MNSIWTRPALLGLLLYLLACHRASPESEPQLSPAQAAVADPAGQASVAQNTVSNAVPQTPPPPMETKGSLAERKPTVTTRASREEARVKAFAEFEKSRSKPQPN